jgi:hypothetical protein
MLKVSTLGLLAALIALPIAAQAQTKKGPNGGTIVSSQGHPIEFVMNGQDLTFFVGDDDGSPLPTKGFKGRATIQDGAKTTTVALQPAAPNKMVGKAESLVGSKARVVFSATFREGSHSHTLTGRYVTQ